MDSENIEAVSALKKRGLVAGNSPGAEKIRAHRLLRRFRNRSVPTVYTTDSVRVPGGSIPSSGQRGICLPFSFLHGFSGHCPKKSQDGIVSLYFPVPICLRFCFPTLSPRCESPALRKAFPRLTLIWIEDKTDALLRALKRGDLVAALLPTIAVPTETHRSQLSIRTLERPVPFRTILLGWRRRSAMADTLGTVAETLRVTVERDWEILEGAGALPERGEQTDRAARSHE